GSLDLLPCVAGDEKQGGSWLVRGGNCSVDPGNFKRTGRSSVPAHWRGCAVALAGSTAAFNRSGRCDGVGDRGVEERLPFRERRYGNRRDVRGYGELCGAESSGSFFEACIGAAVRPTAAESDVDARTKFATFCLGIVHSFEHCRRKERKVFKALGGIVEDLGVDKRQFSTANAVGLHLLKFAKNLGLLYGGSKPPPANHRLGFGWRHGKVLLESLQGGWRAGGGTGRRGLVR